MLERTLAAEGYEVMGVSDGGAALASVERAVPDLVVLDVGLPDLDGFAVCRRLRDRGLALPVLMLTARDAVGDRVAGLDVGADDYLVKPFATEELLARVRALLRRGEVHVETVLQAGDLEMDLLHRRVTRGGEEIELKHREFEVLEYLLRHKNAAVTRD